MNKPNIIFIVMDALRTKNLGCYNYPRNTSPNIDSLAKQGTLFENAFSSNNSTYKSFLAILSGRNLLLEGKKDVFFKEEEIKSFFSSGGIFLQEILKKAGYKTYCLKELGGWQKIGFDEYITQDLEKTTNTNLLRKLKGNQLLRPLFRKITHRLSKKTADKIKAKYGRLRSEEITKKAINIIKKSNKDNFFLWVDFNDTHIPYNPRQFTNQFHATKPSENFFKKISNKNYNKEMVEFWRGAFNKNETIEDIKARYDNAIFYNDYLIGKILETLRQEELLNNTIIFFFSDHGESLDEHEIYWDHHGLYDVTTRVPLIVKGPGIPKNKKIDSFVQHEDLVPTILDILKIKKDPFWFDGKSLLPQMSRNQKKIRDSIFMQEGDKLQKQAIRTEKYKYLEAQSKEEATCTICNNTHQGVIELYDLEKDPGEMNNLAKQNPKVLKQMSLKLNKKIRELKTINEKRRIRKSLQSMKNA